MRDHLLGAYGLAAVYCTGMFGGVIGLENIQTPITNRIARSPIDTDIFVMNEETTGITAFH
jgi:hypothetical protein